MAETIPCDLHIDSQRLVFGFVRLQVEVLELMSDENRIVGSLDLFFFLPRNFFRRFVNTLVPTFGGDYRGGTSFFFLSSFLILIRVPILLPVLLPICFRTSLVCVIFTEGYASHLVPRLLPTLLPTTAPFPDDIAICLTSLEKSGCLRFGHTP